MLSPEKERELIAIIQTDNDDVMRAHAISTLSIGYLRSDNRMIGGLIADFVRDDSVSRDLRLVAYFCLLDVSTRSCEEYPDMKTFRFPDDVDWTFLNQYSMGNVKE